MLNAHHISRFDLVGVHVLSKANLAAGITRPFIRGMSSQYPHRIPATSSKTDQTTHITAIFKETKDSSILEARIPRTIWFKFCCEGVLGVGGAGFEADGAIPALGGPFAILLLLEGAPGGFDMDAMNSTYMSVRDPIQCASRSILLANHCKPANTSSRRANRVTDTRNSRE